MNLDAERERLRGLADDLVRAVDANDRMDASWAWESAAPSIVALIDAQASALARDLSAIVERA